MRSAAVGPSGVFDASERRQSRNGEFCGGTSWYRFLRRRFSDGHTIRSPRRQNSILTTVPSTVLTVTGTVSAARLNNGPSANLTTRQSQRKPRQRRRQAKAGALHQESSSGVRSVDASGVRTPSVSRQLCVTLDNSDDSRTVGACYGARVEYCRGHRAASRTLVYLSDE